MKKLQLKKFPYWRKPRDKLESLNSKGLPFSFKAPELCRSPEQSVFGGRFHTPFIVILLLDHCPFYRTFSTLKKKIVGSFLLFSQFKFLFVLNRNGFNSFLFEKESELICDWWKEVIFYKDKKMISFLGNWFKLKMMK